VTQSIIGAVTGAASVDAASIVFGSAFKLLVSSNE